MSSKIMRQAGAAGLIVLVTALGCPKPGRAIPSLCDAIAGNLVTNCGFETGNFTGWTATPAPSSLFGVNSSDPHSGNYEAFFMVSGSISQSIPTLAGSTYRITFWLANDEIADFFDATFGSTSLLHLIDAPAFPYTMYSADVVASATSTLLTFAGEGPVDTLFLDDVSVVLTAVPEPASLALFGTALVGFGVMRRRRRVS